MLSQLLLLIEGMVDEALQLVEKSPQISPVEAQRFTQWAKEMQVIARTIRLLDSEGEKWIGEQEGDNDTSLIQPPTQSLKP